MKALTQIAGVALVFIYAIGSGIWVNTGDNWYRDLNAPSWQPPDFIFGIIWPYNFIVLGIAAVVVAQRLNTATTLTFLLALTASIACALAWAYQFYRPHNLQSASIALAAAAILPHLRQPLITKIANIYPWLQPKILFRTLSGYFNISFLFALIN